MHIHILGICGTFMGSLAVLANPVACGQNHQHGAHGWQQVAPRVTPLPGRERIR